MNLHQQKCLLRTDTTTETIFNRPQHRRHMYITSANSTRSLDFISSPSFLFYIKGVAEIVENPDFLHIFRLQ